MVDLVRNDIPLDIDDDSDTDALFDWLSTIAGENNLSSVWSMMDIRDFTAVPFPDVTRLEYDGGWGEAGGVDLPPHATWLDLWKAADALIANSGDDHHVFIEEFELVEGDLYLHTGS